MNKITFLLIALCTFSLGFAQAEWSKINPESVQSIDKVNRKSMPDDYAVYQLNLDVFKQRLVGAPVRGAFSGRSTQVIYLPNQEGNLERFYVMETPIMEPELARKFPMIKSYAAQGVDEPGAVARFSITQFGLHSMTFTNDKSTLFIDPFTTDAEHYIVYTKAAISNTPQDFECLIAEINPATASENNVSSENSTTAADDSKLRTYRLALSCTGEYGALFAGTGTVQQRKANIQAQMAITMTRVNGVYEKDLSITMVFVANNDLLLYFDGLTDPWNGEFNNQTAQTIDAAIGLANYDVGHNFNTSGGGNAGCIGCVCSTTSSPFSQNHKGRGFTGLANPTGDAFDIDYVAHELGHQFGGFHTQSNAGCFSGSGSTEVEPGSGSTIMGYAGICAANVQNNSDDYFHYVNIRDILNNVKFGVSSSCAQITSFTNAAPVITPLPNYIIPISTPFELRATATDPNGDAMTYTWEQNDPQFFNQANNLPPNVNNVNGPMFRSIKGTANATRFFPRMSTILAGQTSSTWEVLPAVGRTMNFALTVRDNAAGGSQTATDEVQITVAGNAGPFAITSQNAPISYVGGSNQTVTWDVAATDIAPVNTPFVDIFMSTNNGGSFPILLASQVPNDGSEIITIPNSPGQTNRIMVRGHNTIFFDVSNSSFTITAAPASFALSFSGIVGEQNKSVCKGGSLTFTLPYTTFNNFSATTTFAATNLPAGLTASFSPASATAATNVVVTLTSNATTIPGFYAIPIQATSGSAVKTVNIYANILDNAFSAVSLISPQNAAQVSPNLVTFNWSASNGATLYDIQIATNANFTTIVEQATVTTTSYSSTTLGNVQTYFWRILPKNQGCSGTFGAASTFSTLFCGTTNSLNVPVTIPTVVSSVTSTITIPSTANVVINDLNVQLAISHSYVSDLIVRLTSPAGTEVLLFSGVCDDNANINAVFDDAGQTLVCGTNPAVSGLIVPQQPLSVFNGQNTQGVWTLTVNDTFNQDGGAITNWGLLFCSQAVPLTVVKNELNNLMVYPNPNNGSFTVQFANPATNQVNITIYDTSGRTIFLKEYNVQGNFNENIQLNSIQSGVYLMSIFDGERTEVKRIIVK